MRMLPSINRSRSKSKTKASEDHRRSWHVGTGHHANRRSSKGGKRRTWHFPRISRHSMHPHFSRHDELEMKVDSSKQGKVLEGYDAEKAGDQPQERKKFTYAAHAANETATRAPSPPDSTDTGATDDPESRQQDQNHNKRKDSWLRKVKHKTFRAFRAFEDFLFPGCHPLHGSVPQQQTRVRGGVLMRSCLTVEEHKAKARETVELANTVNGEEGLRAVGFEYRLVACQDHRKVQEEDCVDEENCGEPDITAVDEENCGELDKLLGQEKSLTENLPGAQDPQELPGLLPEDGREQDASESKQDDNSDAGQHLCQFCAHRLFHIESNSLIDSTNRKLFLADGEMYDAVTRLCQENAHEEMQRRYGMVWVTLCPPCEENGDPHTMMRIKHEPIRALVNAEHFAAQEMPNDVSKDQVEYFSRRPTLLIVTGKGKVRAGIFSRQFSLLSGMESSTALPLIHEARLRKLNIVMIDPNCHGDALGMITFEKSMAKAFNQWEGDDKENSGLRGSDVVVHQKQSCRDLYILSHSASGSQLARYLLDKSEYYLPHIRAIAFTDSTHNVQWARQRGNNQLAQLLESPACIYFRCATADKDANWSKHHAGEEAPTDRFWKHRFGNIRTCWAGTKEHSLTNWFAHTFIWQHFDQILQTHEDKEANQ